MNAITMAALPQGRLTTALAAMRACTTRRHLNWMVGTYLVLLAAACLLGVVFESGESSRAEGLALFALLANFSVWAGWLSRLALLHHLANDVRLPGIAGAVGTALTLAAAVTVVLPGVALLALGVPAPVALGASVLGVVGGLLFALMPWPAAMALLAVPAVVQALPSHLPPPGALQISGLVALGVLVLIVCWRSVLGRADHTAIPAWRRPIVLQAPGGMVTWTRPDAGPAHDAPKPFEGLVGMPRPTHGGPHAPGVAIDMLLAGPLGYLAPRAVAGQWSLMMLLMAALLVIPFRGDATLLRDAFLVGTAIGLLAGGWTLALRLQRQRRRASGELAELALLPGLGDPVAATARLLRRVGVRLAQLMLFALLGLLVVVRVQDPAWPHVVLLLAMPAGVGAASWLLCVSAMTDQDIATWRMGLHMLPLLVAVIGTIGVAMIGIPLGGHAFTGLAVWAALVVVYLAHAQRALRRLRGRAHAFLID